MECNSCKVVSCKSGTVRKLLPAVGVLLGVSRKIFRTTILQNTCGQTNLAGYSRFSVVYHDQITAFLAVDQNFKKYLHGGFFSEKKLENRLEQILEEVIFHNDRKPFISPFLMHFL